MGGNGCAVEVFFFLHNYDFGWLQTIKSMNWNIPKRSMNLHFSLVLMANFYSTFSICFIYLLFKTRCPPSNFAVLFWIFPAFSSWLKNSWSISCPIKIMSHLLSKSTSKLRKDSVNSVKHFVYL